MSLSKESMGEMYLSDSFRTPSRPVAQKRGSDTGGGWEGPCGVAEERENRDGVFRPVAFLHYWGRQPTFIFREMP